MNRSSLIRGLRIGLLGIVVSFGATQREAVAQDKLLTTIYNDSQDVIQDLIEASLGRGVDEQLSCSNPVIATYMRKTLNQLTRGNWGVVKPILREELANFAGDYVCFGLTHKVEVEVERKKVKANVNMGGDGLGGLESFIKFLSSNPREIELECSSKGEQDDACASLSACSEGSPKPVRRRIKKSMIEKNCSGQDSSKPTYQCSLALAAREGVGGHHFNARIHLVDAAVRILETEAKQSLSPALEAQLRKWLMNPESAPGQLSLAIREIEGSPGGLGPEPPAPTKQEILIQKLIRHMSRYGSAWNGTGAAAGTISLTAIEIRALLQSVVDGSQETLKGFDDSALTFLGAAMSNNSNMYAAEIFSKALPIASGVIKKDILDKATENSRTKISDEVIDPYSRFLISFVSYILSTRDGEEHSAEAREAFRSASTELLLAVSSSGYTHGDSWLSADRWRPMPGIAATWSYGYSSGGQESQYRTRVSLGWPVFRIKIINSGAVRGGFQLSVLDFLGPVTETATRPNGAYRKQNRMFAEFLRPRAELWFGMPAISKNVVLHAGVQARVVTTENIQSGDDGKMFEYKWVFGKSHKDLDKIVGFGIGASYVF